MKYSTGFFLLLWICSSLMAATPASVLVDSEHSFCKMAGEKGRQEAFVTFLADDSVVFRPGPVPGRKFYKENPSSTGTLTWEPLIADISIKGDLGYTTGPWQFRKSKEDPQVFYGYYFSIWKKQPDGSWLAMLDDGVSAGSALPPVKELLPAPGKDLVVDASSALDVVARVDSSPVYSDDAVFLRNEKEMIRGSKNSKDLFPTDVTWEHGGGNISANFAYTYGAWKAGSENGHYVRAWKNGKQGWKVVVDLLVKNE